MYIYNRSLLVGVGHGGVSAWSTRRRVAIHRQDTRAAQLATAAS